MVCIRSRFEIFFCVCAICFNLYLRWILLDMRCLTIFVVEVPILFSFCGFPGSEEVREGMVIRCCSECVWYGCGWWYGGLCVCDGGVVDEDMPRFCD